MKVPPSKTGRGEAYPERQLLTLTSAEKAPEESTPQVLLTSHGLSFFSTYITFPQSAVLETQVLFFFFFLSYYFSKKILFLCLDAISAQY
jgi:hypothetical protein